MSEMYGPGDPTKITGLPLSKEDVILKARHICQTAMPLDWEWGLLPPTEEAKQRFPRIEAEKRGPCRNRALDKEDPDPYIHWTDLKMGRTHTSRPASTDPQVHEQAVPLQAEVGQEFLEKLTSQDKKRKAPETEAGPSEVPPAKRPKKPSRRHYKRRDLPTSDGPALKISKSASGMPPESSEEGARPSPPPRQSPVPSGAGNSSASPLGGTTSAGRAAPTSPDHRMEEDLVSPPKNQDTGASNTGADTEDAGRVETLVSTAFKKKKKISASSSSKPVPETSAPAKTTPVPGAPAASAPPKTTSMPPPARSAGGSGAAKPPTPPPSQEPVVATTKPAPPPEGAKLRVSEPFKGKGTASGSQSLVLHTGPAAIVAGEKATGLLGRITELKREGRELGHLLDYAEKWNQADVSSATHGLGKDRLPAVDPAGPRCTEEHFMRLKRAVKEFDNAWHDATSNVVSTANARKQLFEELLWEHRDLAEAHSHCQAIPEASIEALQTQLSELHAAHPEAPGGLGRQKAISRELKEQAIQAGLRHDQEMRDAKTAAEAKLAEVLEDSSNSGAVLRAELEEERKARKAAEHRIELTTTDHREYDRLVMQIDALALKHFPDSQTHAVKKVMDDRVARQFANLEAPWDGYDYLVALSARVQHMRSVDRALPIFRTSPSKSARCCGLRRQYQPTSRSPPTVKDNVA
ncbi:hypothetical protein QYE76_012890 [Lolium multiflorum]|uniref:Uncharacterized protein n=1 Tax=Lolium multiflorum TaxID=4521 RepID=A0AAD8U1X6_LOLMU|nr:hypothetical protein QYE76_012890 [Lolium multiflorum]